MIEEAASDLCRESLRGVRGKSSEREAIWSRENPLAVRVRLRDEFDDKVVEACADRLGVGKYKEGRWAG